MIALSEENPSVVSDPESALYDPLSPYYDEDLDSSAAREEGAPTAAPPVIVGDRSGGTAIDEDTDANVEEIDVGEDAELEMAPDPDLPPPTPFLQRRVPGVGAQVWQVGLAALLLGVLAGLLGSRRR